jgi:hypothetical protein
MEIPVRVVEETLLQLYDLNISHCDTVAFYWQANMMGII